MLRLISTLFFTLFVATVTVRGQDLDYFWGFDQGGDFDVAVFWIPFLSGPGGPTDRVHFELGVSPANRYIMTNVNGINEQLIVESDSLELQIGDYETVGEGSGFSSSLSIGRLNGSQADVLFSGGADSQINTVNTSIGVLDVATGNLMLEGAGLTWDNAWTVFIGDAGTGNLFVHAATNVSTRGCIVGHQPGSRGTLEVDGTNSLFTCAGNLFVGENGEGTIRVQNGSSFATEFSFIGYNSEADGNVTVSGQNTTWSQTRDVEIATQGAGSLNVKEGGFFEITAGAISVADGFGSTGQLSIDGANTAVAASSSIVIGNDGDGSLYISNGGTLSNTISGVGNLPGSFGNATVSGVDSVWHCSALTVSNRGSGILSIENGGIVESSQATIGLNLGSLGTVNVDGSESMFCIENYLLIGDGGTGILEIENGATVVNQTGVIGSLLDASGAVMVDGTDSSWINHSDLFIGEIGEAWLFVQHGGAVSCDSAFVGFAESGSGIASVFGADSLWMIANQLSIGSGMNSGSNGSGTLTVYSDGVVDVGGGTVLNSGGTLNLQGGVFTAQNIDHSNGGEFNFTGGSLQVETFEGDLLNAGGTMAPGQSAGSTVIFGNYDQLDSGRLEIEIGGPLINNEYDFVNVIGDVTVDGELAILMINEFVPEPEHVFTVLSSNSPIIGFFGNAADNQRVDTVNGMGSFLVRYGVTSPNPNQVILSDYVPSFVLGDVNGDGEVNLLDVDPFISLLSTGTFYPAADINQDGEVNLLDVGPFIALLAG